MVALKNDYPKFLSIYTAQVFASQDNVSVSDRLVLSTEENGPPKPPRSAFMCFTDAKKKELLIVNSAAKKKDILKTVAVEWSKLSDRDRAFWDEEARNDKVRCVTLPLLTPKLLSTGDHLNPPSLSIDLSVRRQSTKVHGIFRSAEQRNTPSLRKGRAPLFSVIQRIGALM